jgi:hypothetical protein
MAGAAVGTGAMAHLVAQVREGFVHLGNLLSLDLRLDGLAL